MRFKERKKNVHSERNVGTFLKSALPLNTSIVILFVCLILNSILIKRGSVAVAEKGLFKLMN